MVRGQVLYAVFLPYFASAASPRWDPSARGSLLGMTFAHIRADIARAFVEGITMEQKDILNSIVQAGVSLDTIRIMGGATKSDVWNQIQADIYNMPVETLKVEDAAVLGAAMAAAVGMGYYKNIAEAADTLVKPARRYEPKKENIGTYGEKYALYVNTYEALSVANIFKDIAAAQGS